MTAWCYGVLLGIAASGGDDLRSMSTEWNDAAELDAWSEHAPEGFTPKWAPPRVQEGHLVLEPKSSGWFEDNQAGHLFRMVQGNFIVTARLDVRGTDGPLPSKEFSLAGLFIRAPRQLSAASWTPGGENWLFLSLGTASPAGRPQYEIKSTANSLSTLKILPAEARPTELRVARHGELFTLMVRPKGKAWRVLDQMIRPDLPEVLNVGLTAYADYPSVAKTYPNYQAYNTRGTEEQGADLIARVDWIRFRRPKTGRFPIANIDAPVAFGRELVAQRRADLFADERSAAGLTGSKTGP